MTTRTAQAQRLVKAISSSQRSIIAMNPRSGIETLGYTVVAEPALTSRRGAGGMCDGLSFAEHNVVMFAPTPGSKRENFTLLHEVAHILVERDDDTLVWLADRENPAVEIERLCEQIAAMLLVPEGLVEEVVGSGPITADDLRTLIGRAQASGPACAIALTPYLGGEGAVVIIDRATQQVVHSSLRGELAIYPWRGVDVPSEHPLHNLQAETRITSKSYWANTRGQRQVYYISATATEKRVYAILCTSDLWGVDVFHGGQVPPERSAVPKVSLRCQCGFRGEARGWPCDVCGRGYCPSCGECDCPRRDRAQALCRVCFCTAPPTDLVDGVCSGCR